MGRDPLQALLSLRRAAVDEAQIQIAAAYRAEHQTVQAVQRATEALDLEMRAASSLAAGDETVEAFARWLPVGRRRIAEAYERQKEAAAVLDQLRTVLMLARAAVRAVETLMQQKQQLAAEAERRREQSIEDEFAGRT